MSRIRAMTATPAPRPQHPRHRGYFRGMSAPPAHDRDFRAMTASPPNLPELEPAGGAGDFHAIDGDFHAMTPTSPS